MFYHLKNLFWAVFVQGVFGLGGFCLGGFCRGFMSGGFCPVTIPEMVYDQERIKPGSEPLIQPPIPMMSNFLSYFCCKLF